MVAVSNSANSGGGCIEDNGANMVGGEEGMAIFPGKILGPAFQAGLSQYTCPPLMYLVRN